MNKAECMISRCSNVSDHSLVCDWCRKTMSSSMRSKMDKLFHDYIRRSKGLKCFHCGIEFTEDRICADHFWFTKARRPDLRYDPRVAEPCCMACNTSGCKNRKNPKDLECPHDFIIYTPKPI